MDSRRRSLAKAISYRIFATVITAVIVWAITGRLTLAFQIGLLDGVAKLAGYFAHERLWARIKYGFPKPPDYEI